MPRGPQDSHGLSTARCPTATPSAAGPASTTVPTTSWPSTWGKEMNAVIGLSSAPSKSMRTCLVSLPQMPVRWVRSTTQSGASGRASGTSSMAIGVAARLARSDEAPSGSSGGAPGSTPNTSAFTSRRLLRERGHRGGEERVGVVRLELDDAFEVGQVVLEPVALDGGDDAVGHQLRRLQGAAVQRGVVVGLVPDLGVDGAREDEPHLDAGVPQIQGQRLAPAAQRELAGRVGGLGGDAET